MPFLSSPQADVHILLSRSIAGKYMAIDGVCWVSRRDKKWLGKNQPGWNQVWDGLAIQLLETKLKTQWLGLNAAGKLFTLHGMYNL